MKPVSAQSRFVRRLSRLFFAFAFAALVVFPVQAAITFEWSAGANCGNSPYAGFTPGGPSFLVSLCASTTIERGCGFSAILQAADTSADLQRNFVVTARTLGNSYPDPNTAITLPLSINNPPVIADFGGTAAFSAPTSIGPGANQLLATFTLAAQASATSASYRIYLSNASEFATDQGDVTCGRPASSGGALPVLTLYAGLPPANAPSAPFLTSIDAGFGRATLNFVPSTFDGGSAITSYTATCMAPGQQTQTAVGGGSPITVNGLTGGVLYTCAITTTNSAGITGGVSGLLATIPSPGYNSLISPLFILLLN